MGRILAGEEMAGRRRWADAPMLSDRERARRYFELVHDCLVNEWLRSGSTELATAVLDMDRALFLGFPEATEAV